MSTATSGETAVAAEGADSVSEVLEKNVEFHKSPRFALLIFRQIDAAKTNERLAAGFKGSEAALQVFFYRHLEVGGNLGFEIRIEWRLSEESTYAAQGSPHRSRDAGRHRAPSSGDMARTRTMTSETRCQ